MGVNRRATFESGRWAAWLGPTFALIVGAAACGGQTQPEPADQHILRTAAPAPESVAAKTQPPTSCKRWVTVPVKIQFELGNSELDEQALAMLEELIAYSAAIRESRPIEKLRTHGHASQVEDNAVVLGMSRATAVMEQLRTLGWDMPNEVLSHGAEAPLCSETADCVGRYQVEARVELEAYRGGERCE